MAKKNGPTDVSGQLREAIAARIAAGATQKEVADLAGIAESQLSRFIDGKRTLRLPTVDRLCQALGLTLNRSRSKDDR